MQLAVPNVVAIAVRMVITMLRILPQVVLLLNVPIVISFKVRGERMRGERVRGGSVFSVSVCKDTTSFWRNVNYGELR